MKTAQQFKSYFLSKLDANVKLLDLQSSHNVKEKHESNAVFILKQLSHEYTISISPQVRPCGNHIEKAKKIIT